MGEGDHMPMGRRKKQIDPKKLQKIKEGGKKADAIRERADNYHKAHDIPAAEEELRKDLGSFSDD